MDKTHIRLSDIPPNQWMQIVLIKPMECMTMCIPGKGTYVGYKAYFPFMKDKRVFNFIVPKNKFLEAIKAVPTHLRDDLNKPVKMTFKRNNKYVIDIRSWETI